MTTSGIFLDSDAPEADDECKDVCICESAIECDNCDPFSNGVVCNLLFQYFFAMRKNHVEGYVVAKNNDIYIYNDKKRKFIKFNKYDFSQLPPIELGEKTVQMTILSIENISARIIKSIEIETFYEGTLIRRFQKTLESATDVNEQIPLEFEITFHWNTADPKLIDEIIANPLVIMVHGTSKRGSVSTGNKGKERKKSVSMLPLGSSVVDFLPILLGEKAYREALFVRKCEPNVGTEQVLEAYPILNVEVKATTRMFDKEYINNHNMVNITIESLYNLHNELIFPEYDGITASVSMEWLSDDAEPLELEGACGSVTDNWGKFRRWPLLITHGEIEMPVTSHRVALNNDFLENHLSVEADLQKCIGHAGIEWNRMRRLWLSKEETENLKKYIKDGKKISVEIRIKPKPRKGSTAKRKTVQMLSLFAYIDLGTLMYPGKHSCRAISQVYILCDETLTGSESCRCLYLKMGDEPKPRRAGTSSKVTNRASHIKSVSFVSETPGGGGENVPMFTETGQPMFLVVNFELEKPLEPMQSTKSLQKKVMYFLPKPIEDYPLTPNRVNDEKFEFDLFEYLPSMKHLHDTFRLLHHVSLASQFFIKKQSKPKQILQHACKYNCHFYKKVFEYCEDMLDSIQRGNFETFIPEMTLGSLPCVGIPEIQEYITVLYHELIGLRNKFINDSNKCDRSKIYHITVPSQKELLLISEEAFEEGDLDRAWLYHLLRLSTQSHNSDALAEYMFYCYDIDNGKTAVKTLHTILQRDPNNKLALIICAISILSLKHNEENAGMLFDLFTRGYPFILEYWVLYNVIFAYTRNAPGIYMTYQKIVALTSDRRVERLLDQPGFDTIKRTSVGFEPAPNFHRSPFIHLAEIIIRSRMYWFAEEILREDAKTFGFTVDYYFCKGLIEFRRKDYKSAILYLTQATKKEGKKCASVISLLIQCYYKLDQFDKVDKHVSRDYLPLQKTNVDSHMLNLRMGKMYLQRKEYTKAKFFFEDVCRVSPTPATLRLFGIALYRVERYDQAEAVLDDAVAFEDSSPSTWVLYVMIYLKREKWLDANVTYTKMLTYEPEEDDLWRELHSLIEEYSSNYPWISDLSVLCENSREELKRRQK